MKALLLSSAFALCLAAPAYAGKPAPPPPAACPGPFCLTSPDKEEVKMFNDIANKDVLTFQGSIHGNGKPAFFNDITVTTNAKVTTGSGFANIKDGDDLDWTFAEFAVNPIGVNALDPSITTKNFLDGFFVRGQLVFSGDGKAPKDFDPTFSMIVNKGEANQTEFDFDGKQHADFAAFGFDEPLKADGSDNDALAAIVHNVQLFAGPDTAFFELKQIDWSPCQSSDLCAGVVINPTGGVPEPSTWAMAGIGFALMGSIGMWRRRNWERFASL